MSEDYSHLIGKRAYKNHDGLFGKLVGTVEKNKDGHISPLIIAMDNGMRLGAFPSDLVIIDEKEGR